MDSLYWLLGIGVGLAAVAGLRAFLPLTLATLGLQLLSGVPGWAVVGVLAALAVAEIALDKPAAVERPLNAAMIVLRALAGGFLVALVVDEQSTLGLLGLTSGAASPGAIAPWFVVGAVVAGSVAVLKVVLRPPGRSAASGVSHTTLSVFEDAVALVGGIVGIFVPLLPLVFVAFLLFFFHRVRRRRGRKYEGLRILRD